MRTPATEIPSITIALPDGGPSHRAEEHLEAVREHLEPLVHALGIGFPHVHLRLTRREKNYRGRYGDWGMADMLVQTGQPITVDALRSLGYRAPSRDTSSREPV
ncbi:hypothetical protein M8Z33_07550 [Streptomyces sp. ZAF1911]|uniref:hypothetical protein n=1 Tax=Streptomyces sp. ZAF1911 TaxID=2944129 RepID=UPI00237B9149|nr:hypothetical protein [Streptomyces sp. ZAF1911]MDD9376529.1 hypothetical protein [Streptomyces sp. ZAF1911]